MYTKQEATHCLPLAQVISRGQIMAMRRERRTALTAISVLVEHHLAPSFYVVAYFYHQGLPVANSLLINIQPGDCEGKVTGSGEVVQAVCVSTCTCMCMYMCVLACVRGSCMCVLKSMHACMCACASKGSGDDRMTG